MCLRLCLRTQVGLKGLDYLLAHWEEETTDCNYGEVNRNLLETKNKEALLEAATTNALFNKDKTMVSFSSPPCTSDYPIETLRPRH